jgi:hypothetical protein
MAAMMANASPGGCLRQPDRHVSKKLLHIEHSLRVLIEGVQRGAIMGRITGYNGVPYGFHLA